MWRPVANAAKAPSGSPLSADDLQVLLVHRPRYHDWSWPKGKAELNEPLPQTAVREVEEETGRAVVLHAPMTTQRYRLGSGHTKEVHYWAARVLGQGAPRAARPPVVPASNMEIDIAKWVSAPKAKQLLTRRGDRRLLGELVVWAEAGLLDTSTVILLRHGKAVSRTHWQGVESERPLARLGAVQSLDIVPMLSAFGVDHILTSPWTRTQQTIAPYVAVTRMAPEQVDYLSETGFAAEPALAGNLMRSLMDKKDGSHAVVLHRPTYEELLAPLIEAKGESRFPVLNDPRPGLRTAEMMIAHIAHPGKPTVVDMERHTTFTKLILS